MTAFEKFVTRPARNAAVPALAVLWLLLPAAALAGTASPRERISLDAGWRFIKGDPADAAGNILQQACWGSSTLKRGHRTDR